ncbi:conserved domain protein [Ruminococcus albus 8]|uniref:Conserved domain protein n=1 Tax=Ruminococcus albus 8 TaxID=246199 RepID=E9SB72_RUMAL|nr:conserved domain protein [Ruminococcus albus 8]
MQTFHKPFTLSGRTFVPHFAEFPQKVTNSFVKYINYYKDRHCLLPTKFSHCLDLRPTSQNISAISRFNGGSFSVILHNRAVTDCIRA